MAGPVIADYGGPTVQSSNPYEPTNQENRTQNENTERLHPAQKRSKSAEEIADAYASVADKLARWQRLDRLFAGRYRRRQFSDANGRVLDVACGTGQNFRYLSSSSEVVGIDISGEMLAHARTELDRLDLDGTVHQMDAQALDFDDDSFDTVISSLSTCTFPDPVAALSEMGRVCAPDGRILLLEHGRSHIGPIARFQDWRADAHFEKHSCRWNQEPLEIVAASPLTVVDSSSAFLGIITAIEARPG